MCDRYKALLNRVPSIPALKPFLVVPKNKVRFWAFIVINCFFGAFGILCPLVVSAYGASGMTQGFWNILYDGNGYTFAVALLAAASYFLIGDAIAARKTSFTSLRISAALFGIVWLIWLSISASAHMSFPSDPSKYPGSAAAITQLLSTLATVAFAIWLFCLERLDDHTDEEAFSDLRDRNKLAKTPVDPTV